MPFTVTKLNTVHTAVFNYQPNKYDCSTSSENSKSSCIDDKEYLIDKDIWSLITEGISLDYDDKLNKLILEGHFLSCLHSDGFSKPTLKNPYTILWFPEEIYFLFHISDFIERTSQLINRYRLETDDLFNTNGKNTDKNNNGIMPTGFAYTNSPLGTTNPTLSRLEKFHKKHYLYKTNTTAYKSVFWFVCHLSWRM